jgi:myo-inositol-1(or 4)-monophosphatase
MSLAALHPMLNIAVKAARSAGVVINRASLDLESIGVSMKAPRDFVTEVDRRAEEIIIDTLLTAFPDHAILAEESGHRAGRNDDEYLWIIDPLDGTTNFIHGFPVYAVSIALSVRGQVQQAVVFDPARNDLFFASKGRGAYLNNKRLRVSKRTRMADALIGTGFPFRRGDNIQRYLQMFEKVAASCAGLRRPGAAALDLCYVAAGWYDGFFETGLSPWDAAAGSLMITEAGGLAGNFTGEPDYLFKRELVCGNPRIYGQLVQMLAPFSQVSPATAKAAGEVEPALAAPGDPTPERALAATEPAAVEDAEPAPPAPARAEGGSLRPTGKAVRIRRGAADAPAPPKAPRASRDDDAPF